MVAEEALQIAEKRREVEGKGEKERRTHLNTVAVTPPSHWQSMEPWWAMTVEGRLPGDKAEDSPVLWKMADELIKNGRSPV